MGDAMHVEEFDREEDGSAPRVTVKPARRSGERPFVCERRCWDLEESARLRAVARGGRLAACVEPDRNSEGSAPAGGMRYCHRRPVKGGNLEPDRERIVSVDQLPDNPLAMPPPYWRSSSAVFCLLDALEAIPDLLAELVPVLKRTDIELDAHFAKYPENQQTDEEMEEFSEIVDEQWEIEHKIKTKVPVVILMSAIGAEDAINRFCVYNLHRGIAESIEQLSPPDKLLVAAGAVGEKIGKGHAVYGAIKVLTQWRNAFAHGHCVDRPTRSLRHNHLIRPDKYPGIASQLSELQRLVPSYVRVSEYMASISRNKYGSGRSDEVERTKELLAEIARYRFIGDDNDIYEIVVLDPEG